MLVNLDTMYYRNSAVIANQFKCSNYKSLRQYSTCTEDKIQATEVVAADFEYKKPAVTTSAIPAPAKPAAAPAPTPGV